MNEMVLSEKEQRLMDLFLTKKQMSFDDIKAENEGSSLIGALGKLISNNLVEVVKIPIGEGLNMKQKKVVKLKE